MEIDLAGCGGALGESGFDLLLLAGPDSLLLLKSSGARVDFCREGFQLPSLSPESTFLQSEAALGCAVREQASLVFAFTFEAEFVDRPLALGETGHCGRKVGFTASDFCFLPPLRLPHHQQLIGALRQLVANCAHPFLAALDFGLRPLHFRGFTIAPPQFLFGCAGVALQLFESIAL
jgi:hypothetical protein